MLCMASVGQQTEVNWSTSLDKERAFIENKGQFDQFATGNTEVKYAVDGGSTMILFTDRGVTYRFSKKVKNQNRERGDRSKPRYLTKTQTVETTWLGTSAEVLAIGKRTDKNIYTLQSSDKSYTEISNVNGYEKLIYKNLYPKIDVEYVIHPEQGIKYNLILHPGADVSQVRMKYSGHNGLSFSKEDDLLISTEYGNIIDHAPVTYYQDAADEKIVSTFVLKENEIGFLLEPYDTQRKVVLDPWVVTPSFGNSNGIWDIDVDNNGNVYIYGGDTPMRLRKYDALGALQWTYNTPWDSANYWIGTMITEPNTGDCFITAGTDPVVSRISTAGNEIWTENGGPLDEYWKFSFNCDYTRLMLGGTRLSLGGGGSSIDGYGYVFEIDMNNGSQINDAEVASTTPGPVGLIDNPNEIRAMCHSPNGKYYYMVLDTVGVFDDNLNLGYKEDHGYNFSYRVAGYGVTNQSINAMAATTDHLYTLDGSTLDKRNIVDGSIIASVTIPNGMTSSELGFNSAENGGLVLDSCGNVYVGSSNQVIKFDQDLNQLASETTPGAVYDVAVNSAGEVVACGQDFAASLDLQPCAPPKAICLNCLELTPSGPYCQFDVQDTLMADPGTGTWSGSGITDPALGIFDPSVADTGLHVIHFTPDIALECGIDSMVIRVNYCVELQACVDSLGYINIPNGLPPYTWSETLDTLDCSACFPAAPPIIPGCSIPPGCAVPTTYIAEFSTDTMVMPTGNWPIFVEDSQGNTLQINSLAELSACSIGCFIVANLPDTVVACTGDSASATVVVSGAIGNIDYSWNTVPVQITQTAVGLAPGSYYTVAVTDDSSCVAIDSVYVTEEPCVGPSACATPFGDIVADGFGPFTWYHLVDTVDCSACINQPPFPECTFPPGCQVTITEYQEFATGETVTPTGNWPIYVMDANGDSLIINSLSELVACPQSCYLEVDLPTEVFTCFGENDGEATATISGAQGNVTYSWNTSPSQSTQTATSLPTGDYIVTVTDANQCEASDTVTVSELPEIVLQASSGGDVCVGTSNGTATASATGGAVGFQYQWNTNPVQSGSTATGLGAGSYNVTVTDQSGCEATQSITVGAFPEVVAFAGDNDSICIGDDLVLTATGGVSYTWNTGDQTSQITVSPDSSATYVVTVTDANGCQDSDTVTVWVVPLPLINWGEIYPTYCIQEPPFQLPATPVGGEFFGPGTSTTGIFDPQVAGPGEHEIFYNYAEYIGCYGETNTLITVEEEGCQVATPNVFNPNTDFNGVTDFCGNIPQNNVFTLTCLEYYPGNRVRIFDRWGRKHYDQTDYHLKPWDGGNQSDGVYYYILEIEDEEAIKGFFHLVR